MSQDVKLLPDPKLPKVLERFVLSSLSQFKALARAVMEQE